MDQEFRAADLGQGFGFHMYRGQITDQFRAAERSNTQDGALNPCESTKMLNLTQSTLPVTQSSSGYPDYLDNSSNFQELSEISNFGLLPSGINQTVRLDLLSDRRSNPDTQATKSVTFSTEANPLQQPIEIQNQDRANAESQARNEQQKPHNPESQIQTMLKEVSSIVSMQTNLLKSELQEAIDTLKLGPRSSPIRSVINPSTSQGIEIPGVSPVQRKALEDLEFLQQLLDLAKEEMSVTLNPQTSLAESPGIKMSETIENMDTCFSHMHRLMQKVAQVKELQAQLKELRSEIKKVKDEAVAWDQTVQGALDTLAAQDKSHRSFYYLTSLQNSHKLILAAKRAKMLAFPWKPSNPPLSKPISGEDQETSHDNKLARAFLSGLDRHKAYYIRTKSSASSGLDPEVDLPSKPAPTIAAVPGKSKAPVKPTRWIFNKYKAPMAPIGEELVSPMLQTLKQGLSNVSGLLRTASGNRN